MRYHFNLNTEKSKIIFTQLLFPEVFLTTQVNILSLHLNLANLTAYPCTRATSTSVN